MEHARARRSLVGAVAVTVAAALAAAPFAIGAAPGRPIQELVAGHGLAGGGTANNQGSVSLAVDPAVVQTRVAGACVAGSSISSIAQDGTVTCETDDDSAYAAGLGLVLSGYTFSVDTNTIQARIAGVCPVGQAIRAVTAAGIVLCQAVATGSFIANGTSPQNASFNITGSGRIGSASNPFANKLRVMGGAWNPNDTDGDVLIGDSLYRLKIGVATGGAGAGDVRIRAMGGTNRLSLGSGTSDVLNIRDGKIGVNVFDPQAELDVAGDVAVSGQVRKSYASGTSNPALPIAFGIVDGFGAVVNATPNVSAAYNAAREVVEITFAGESYDGGSYVTVVTPLAATRIVASTEADAGKLVVRLIDPNGNPRPVAFQFVTYKL